jgi:hypothetical protein
MALPLLFAGPTLCLLEPSLEGVWVALSDACTVKLALRGKLDRSFGDGLEQPLRPLDKLVLDWIMVEHEST